MKAVDAGTCRFWQALTVGVATLRGWRGWPLSHWPIGRGRKARPPRMELSKKRSKANPQVKVEQASISPGPAPGRWLMSWRIRNLEQESLELLTARLPHSLFRSEDKELALRAKLSPGASTLVEVPVLCREPSGSVVDNAFLILHLLWRDERWLVFARLQVIIDTEGRPQATTQIVTTQPAGLSG